MKIRTLQDALDACRELGIHPGNVNVSLEVVLTPSGPRIYDPNERRLEGADELLKSILCDASQGARSVGERIFVPAPGMTVVTDVVTGITRNVRSTR